jgi:Family of unknown function (DUF6152)
MKFRLFMVLAGLTLAAGSGLPLLAHHSFAAQYDATKAIRMTGTLVKIEWTNPHSYIYIDVKEDNGTVTKWTCEAGSLGALSRQGFKRSTVKFGDNIIVDGYRAKDGSRLMVALRVSLPNGKILLGEGVDNAGSGGAARNP